MNAPARIVVRGPNWLGDLVMAAPSIREIGDHWPDAQVDVAVPSGLAPIVSMLDPRVGVVPLAGRTGLGAVARHAAQLREGRYDLALLLTNSFGTALAAQRAGIPERWGYRRDGRGWLLTRAVRRRAVTRTSRHHADYYAALIEAGVRGGASRVFALAGATSLRARAGVLGVATRVLANDSGAMHVAAALGTPVVAVFGPTREYATAPLGPHHILTHEVWCRPCMLRECPLDHRCMTGVGPQRVLDALRS
mgnify:CR=1 FL=1